MSVQIDIADEILIARLIGDIDHHSAKEMRETIDEAVTRAQVRELDLDFKDVTFMDSSGIGLVMGRYKLMQELGGSVHLVNIASRLAVMEKTERPKAMAKTGDNGGNDDESN